MEVYNLGSDIMSFVVGNVGFPAEDRQTVDEWHADFYAFVVDSGTEWDEWTDAWNEFIEKGGKHMTQPKDLYIVYETTEFVMVDPNAVKGSPDHKAMKQRLVGHATCWKRHAGAKDEADALEHIRTDMADKPGAKLQWRPAL
jgi:hypothetical protein|tara:strand:+ start:2502 stop:2927 length:426 start_codon:yes stop_codon:yes gene_type:complete